MGRNADYARLFGDRTRNIVLDPPACIGGELVAEPEVEFFERAEEPEIAFLNQVVERQPAVAVFLRDADDKPEIGLDHFLAQLLQLFMGIEQLPDVPGEFGEGHQEPVLKHLEPLAVDRSRREFDPAVEVDAGLEHLDPVDDDLKIFAELVAGDIEFGEDAGKCFAARRIILASGFEGGRQLSVAALELFAPDGELGKQLPGRDLLFTQRRRLKIVGRVGIRVEAFVKQPEMLLRHKPECVQLFAHGPGHGVDLIAELLLLFRRQGRQLADLPEITGKGVRKIIGAHFGQRMRVDRRFRNRRLLSPVS